MAAAARVTITNVPMGGPYAATILVGAQKRPLNVLLDTGSGPLVLDAAKYAPGAGDKTTRLAQTEGYGDGGSWTGAVVKTDISISAGAATLKGANAAIAYQASANVFGGADGILGLGNPGLNGAYLMAGDSWAHRYSADDVKAGHATTIAPCLARKAAGKTVSNVIALYTRRSQVHRGGGDALADPLNQGVMIVGGGQNGGGLYAGLSTGAFQTAKVVADTWYNTNLKAIIVGAQSPIAIAAAGLGPSPSNSIVDSGNPGVSFGPNMLAAVLAKFGPAQQAQLSASLAGGAVAAADLELNAWPSLTFVLEGATGDIRLEIAPRDYWQVNAPAAGAAKAVIKGDGVDGFVSLGLPLMNGYLTIFDGARGAVRFAPSVR